MVVEVGNFSGVLIFKSQNEDLKEILPSVVKQNEMLYLSILPFLKRKIQLGNASLS
jgi:hypothetical protein